MGGAGKEAERKSMKQKYLFVAAMLLGLLLAGVLLTNIYVAKERGGGNAHGHSHDNVETNKQEFHILTSFYPMYIAAKNIVGDCDGVILENLSEPQTGCMHDYQLTTEDMRRISLADAFIINGGGIESFLGDVTGQYPQLAVINASAHVQLLEDNAHVWMSIPDHMTQVRTITDQLAGLDPSHASVYKENGKRYLDRLEELRQSQQEVAEKCKADNILIFHEAFAYVAKDYGLHVSGGMDLDEERQVSAGEAADLLAQIKEHQAGMILAEELYGRQMCEMIQRETDVTVIYLDPCVRGEYDADHYFITMKENIERMKEAWSAREIQTG